MREGWVGPVGENLSGVVEVTGSETGEEVVENVGVSDQGGAE